MAREALEKSSSESTGLREHESGDSEQSEDLKGAKHTLGFFDVVVLRVLGYPGQLLCSLSIAFAQITTVIAYLDTISDSIESYVLQGQRSIVLALIGAVVASLSTVKTLTGVSYLSLMGLLTYLVIFIALVVEAFRYGFDGTLGDSTKALRASGRDYGTWFGISAFAFGGFAIAVVVYDDMKEPRHFYRVVSMTYLAVWLFYTAFALLGYFCYGEHTDEVIYFNFPDNSALKQICVASVCVVLLLTYVVQMMPVYSWAESFSKDIMHYAVVRGIIVLLTLVIALFVRNLVLTITIGGAVASAVSSFVLPPVAYLIVQPRAHWTEWVLAVGLVVLGVGGAVHSIITV
uniref:Amino acid transporter transmembrane domain-containing protein n=1 Tax=Alexandrium catenella TaxID=2925 RepID=A0A7S1M3I3_ALECA